MLTFILKKEWFEKIERGEKTVEYREIKPYWIKRINNEIGWGKINKVRYSDVDFGPCYIEHPCRFRRAYTDVYIDAYIKKIEIVSGINTDLKIDKLVYAITFELLGD